MSDDTIVLAVPQPDGSGMDVLTSDLGTGGVNDPLTGYGYVTCRNAVQLRPEQLRKLADQFELAAEMIEEYHVDHREVSKGD